MRFPTVLAYLPVYMTSAKIAKTQRPIVELIAANLLAFKAESYACEWQCNPTESFCDNMKYIEVSVFTPLKCMQLFNTDIRDTISLVATR